MSIATEWLGELDGELIELVLQLLAHDNPSEEQLAEMREQVKLALEKGFAEDPAQLETGLDHLVYGMYVLKDRVVDRRQEAEVHIERAVELGFTALAELELAAEFEEVLTQPRIVELIAEIEARGGEAETSPEDEGYVDDPSG